MKYLMIFSLLMVLFDGYAQDYKRSNKWTMGLCEAYINFNTISPEFQYLSFCYTITNSNSNICDTNGNLLFYSTGFTLANKDSVISNGEKINCPFGTELYNHSPFYQSTIILPKKGNQYYVFNTGMSDSVANVFLNGNGYRFDVLSYCVVDMDSNNGQGMVIIKDKVLADSQIYYSQEFTAVKHGNGQDWWLIKPDVRKFRFETYQVTPDAILGPYYQALSDTGNFATGLYNFIVANKQGTKLAWGGCGMLDIDSNNDTLYNWNRVDIFDFDRCTGIIKNQKYYRTPFDTSTYYNYDMRAGGCFSEDGNLFYLSHDFTIYQIDLLDTAIYNGILIASMDTLVNYFPLFSYMSLGPNGKVYIGNFHGINKTMCFIDSPNVRGIG
jgi:hypothetical protein